MKEKCFDFNSLLKYFAKAQRTQKSLIRFLLGSLSNNKTDCRVFSLINRVLALSGETLSGRNQSRIGRMIPQSVVVLIACIVGAISAQDTSHLPPCTIDLQFRHFPSGFDWYLFKKIYSFTSIINTLLVNVANLISLVPVALGFSNGAQIHSGLIVHERLAIFPSSSLTVNLRQRPQRLPQLSPHQIRTLSIVLIGE